MDSIKQICERSKWLQSLLPAPQILAFNDWIRPTDRERAANQPDGSDIMQRVEMIQTEKQQEHKYNSNINNKSY